MKYIANPVEVEAKIIKRVLRQSAVNSVPDKFILELEDGSEFVPEAGMVTRMTPAEGDYVVTQSDGYVYLNPKEVFERKYRAA